MHSRWGLSRAVLIGAIGAGLGMTARELILRRREANLQGQVVLITGGSRGLGFLLAKEFAKEGCRVAICARDDQELGRARQDLARGGVEVLAANCDISDRGQIEGLVQAVKRQFGRVDILVNNGGIIQVGPVRTMTLQDFEDAVNIMFWGMLYPTLEVLPGMLQQGSGRIVNITSVGGKVSVPHLLPYNCAKFATVGLSEGLRPELTGHGITVTTIVPGLMRTGSYLNALFKGNQEGEFTWFSLGSSLPLISMDGERAARQIVRATKRGEPEIILSMPANILARFHGLFPGTVINLLGVINRVMLPVADGAGTAQARGMKIQGQLKSPMLNLLTGWGLKAARRFHQYPGPLAVPDNERHGERAAG